MRTPIQPDHTACFDAVRRARASRRCRRIAGLTAAAGLWLATGSAAVATPAPSPPTPPIARDCRPPDAARPLPVRVLGPGLDPDDLRDACHGAADAIDFLAPAGLAPPALLQIEVLPALPPEVPARAVACWMVRTGRVVVLPHAQVLARKRWFGIPVQRPLYRAIVAHEVAHALLGCQLGAAATTDQRPLPMVAHEYLAYVTLMATLPPALREAVLKAHPDADFDDIAQINAIVYGFDPESFGVAAWRHWQRQSDGMDFLRRVIRGEAIQNVLPD